VVVAVVVVALVEFDFEFHVVQRRPSVNFAIGVVIHFDD
jgi:hypothetical protein